MNESKKPAVACLFASLVALCGAGSCGKSIDVGAEQAAETGSISVALETVSASGTRYRISNATFRITSVDDPSLVRFINVDDRSTTEILVELPAGTYTVEITPTEGDEFVIEEILDDLTTVPAENVELVTDTVQTIEVVDGQDTNVNFGFEVGEIALGFGELVVEIEVNERGFDAGAAISTDAGDVSGESPDSGVTTDPTEACNECLDAEVPGGLNAACSSDVECAAVRDCVIVSDCFQLGKSPSVCYCGEDQDINECQDPTFVPQGTCASEITDAFAADGQATDNATIVGQLAADGTTSGQAFNILIGSSQFGFCLSECSLE